MTCPHCQKKLPENRDGDRCPFCGGELLGKDVPVLQPPLDVQVNWHLFLLALLLPPSLTQLAALICGHLTGPLSEGSGGVCAVVDLVGGAVGGIICGTMIAVGLGPNLPAKFVLSLLFSGIIIGICLTLCVLEGVAGFYEGGQF